MRRDSLRQGRDIGLKSLDVPRDLFNPLVPVGIDAAWCLARPFWEAMEAKGMFAFDPTQVQIEA